MSVSALDHKLLAGLFGDAATAGQFSPEAEIAAMLRFEAALAVAEAEAGLIPAEAAVTIGAACERFAPDLAGLAAGASKDGVVAVAFVRQLRAAVGEPHAGFVHFGATSQDVIDTGLMLRLQPVLADFSARLGALATALSGLEARFGGRELMGRTRMQAAIPIRVGDRLRSWRLPVERHKARLDRLAPEVLLLQFGGAAGTLDQLDGKGAAVASRLAELLGLGQPEQQWHSQRDRLVELAGLLALITGSLGKFGQDVALMAQNGPDEIRLSGGGGSSAMAHKSNPVVAEALVALARFTAALGGAMNSALVHEQERSGAAWSLEWLVLPQLVTGTAGALRLALRLCGQIEGLGRETG